MPWDVTGYHAAGGQDVEVEVGVPGTAGRRRILELMLARAGHALAPQQLDALAAATHGAAAAAAFACVRGEVSPCAGRSGRWRARRSRWRA